MKVRISNEWDCRETDGVFSWCLDCGLDPPGIKLLAVELWCSRHPAYMLCPVWFLPEMWLP